MDLYEEFGVPPTATPEEIRHAHRSLARLLHPDQHQDPQLRRLAEAQMKRINAACALLTDPQERRLYDLGLRQAPPQRLLPGHRRGWGRAVTAGLALFLGGVASAFLVGVPRERPAMASIAAPPAADRPPQAGSSSRSPSPRPAAGSPRIRPSPASGKAKAEVRPPSTSTPTPPEMPRSSDLPRAEPLVRTLPPAPVEPQPREESGVRGQWFYARSPKSNEPDVYPPVFIELRIEESGGRLAGSYRGRYRVTNRALSPDVAFEFEGPAEGSQFVWQGNNGARGEVRLRLVSANTLAVEWLTTRFGQRAALGSGSAVLYRRQIH